MPYVLVEYYNPETGEVGNWAEWLDWDDTQCRTHRAFGEPYWPTLLGPITKGGVQASAFVRPFAVEPLYDTREALAGWPVVPPPIGRGAVYKILHANGKTYWQGIHRSQLPELPVQVEKELQVGSV